MPRNSTLLKTWFIGVGLSGLSLLVFSARDAGMPSVEAILIFGVLIGLAEWRQVILPHGEGMSTALGVVLSVLWIYGPGTAMGAEVVGSLIAALFARSRVQILLFNVGQLLWSVAAGYAAFTWAGMAPGQPIELTDIWPWLFSGTLFSLTNTVLLAIGLALHNRHWYGD